MPEMRAVSDHEPRENNLRGSNRLGSATSPRGLKIADHLADQTSRRAS
jgi:hypothetical protein